MDGSRRDFFRLGGGNLLRTLADLAGGGLDRLAGPRPVSVEEAGQALRGLNLKRRSVPAFGTTKPAGESPAAPNTPPSDAPGPTEPEGH